MKCAIVTPTYNEAGNLEDFVARILKLNLNDVHILVVDDNSPDGTGQLADRLATQHPGTIIVVHRQKKSGLGLAYIAGFKRALALDADAIIQMDTDLSHEPETIPAMLELLSNNDVVVGSRYVNKQSDVFKWSFLRKTLSGMGNVYARAVTGLKVKDVTSGFKCFSRKALAGLPLDSIRCSGFAFQIEVASLCQARGYSVVEVPINFKPRAAGRSKMSLGIPMEALWRVWQIRLTTRGKASTYPNVTKV